MTADEATNHHDFRVPYDKHEDELSRIWREHIADAKMDIVGAEPDVETAKEKLQSALTQLEELEETDYDTG